jgi:hypothetical protein
MTLVAYFDDSREMDHDKVYHTMAGYVAPQELWDNVISLRWCGVLNAAPRPLTEYKASNCRALKREFRGWDRREADRVTLEIVNELLRADHRPLLGIGTVVVIDNFLTGARLRRFERMAMGMCLLNTVLTIFRYAKKLSRYEPIEFVCDVQPGLQGMFKQLLKENVDKIDWYEPGFRELKFADSRSTPPLQAADLLAYETRKDLKDRTKRKDHPRSTALARMLESHPHIGYAIGGDIVLEMLSPMPAEEWQGPAIIYQSPGLEFLTSQNRGARVRIARDPRPGATAYAQKPGDPNVALVPIDPKADMTRVANSIQDFLKKHPRLRSLGRIDYRLNVNARRIGLSLRRHEHDAWSFEATVEEGYWWIPATETHAERVADRLVAGVLDVWSDK